MIGAGGGVNGFLLWRKLSLEEEKVVEGGGVCGLVMN